MSGKLLSESRGDGFHNGLHQAGREFDPALVDACRVMYATAVRRRVLEPHAREKLGMAVHAAVNTLYGPGIRRRLLASLAAGATHTHVVGTVELSSVHQVHEATIAFPIVLEELGFHVTEDTGIVRELLPVTAESTMCESDPRWVSGSGDLVELIEV